MKAWWLVVVLSYVLPAHSILRRAAEVREELGLNTLRVEGTVRVPHSNTAEVAAALGVEAPESGDLILVAAVALKFPGRCRFELTHHQGRAPLVAVSNNGKSRTEGVAYPALLRLAEQVCALLTIRDAGEGEAQDALEQHLKRMKVDLRKSSLGRLNRTISYVLGDTADGAAQLWLAKDRFSPTRVRWTEPDSSVWDVHFVDYASAATGEWFPRVIEVSRNNELTLSLHVLSGDAKAKIDDAVF